MDITDDKDILEAFRDVEKRDHAFNLLVRKYSPRLYSHIRKMVNSHDEADDLLQNTLIKIWRSLPDFREDSGLYTWLYRIATNETLNFLRRERLRCSLSLTSYSSLVDSRLEADENFDGDEIQRKLYLAVRKLPPKQMAVFNLKYFEDLKYEEIVAILGGTVGSLKASYHHALAKIKASLENTD